MIAPGRSVAYRCIVMAKPRAALGFKVHTGWAAVVAVGAPAPDVLAKARLQVASTFEEGAVFHAGQELPIDKARALVRDSEARFRRQARADLATFVAGLDAEVVTGGVVWGNPKPLPPFETILASHPLVHAAEADLYRRIFADATESVIGLAPIRVPAKDLTARSGAALHLTAEEVARRLTAMGKASGKPWTIDQKEAALVAWLALASA
jgi:hypothetical protein